MGTITYTDVGMWVNKSS